MSDTSITEREALICECLARKAEVVIASERTLGILTRERTIVNDTYRFSRLAAIGNGILDTVFNLFYCQTLGISEPRGFRVDHLCSAHMCDSIVRQTGLSYAFAGENADSLRVLLALVMEQQGFFAAGKVIVKLYKACAIPEIVTAKEMMTSEALARGQHSQLCGLGRAALALALRRLLGTLYPTDSGDDLLARQKVLVQANIVTDRLSGKSWNRTERPLEALGRMLVTNGYEPAEREIHACYPGSVSDLISVVKVSAPSKRSLFELD